MNNRNRRMAGNVRRRQQNRTVIAYSPGSAQPQPGSAHTELVDE